MNKDNKDIIGTDIDNWKNTDLNFSEFKKLNDEILSQIDLIHQGGGPVPHRQQRPGRARLRAGQPQGWRDAAARILGAGARHGGGACAPRVAATERAGAAGEAAAAGG